MDDALTHSAAIRRYSISRGCWLCESCIAKPCIPPPDASSNISHSTPRYANSLQEGQVTADLCFIHRKIPKFRAFWRGFVCFTCRRQMDTWIRCVRASEPNLSSGCARDFVGITPKDHCNPWNRMRKSHFRKISAPHCQQAFYSTRISIWLQHKHQANRSRDPACGS